MTVTVPTGPVAAVRTPVLVDSHDNRHGKRTRLLQLGCATAAVLPQSCWLSAAERARPVTTTPLPRIPLPHSLPRRRCEPSPRATRGELESGWGFGLAAELGAGELRQERQLPQSFSEVGLKLGRPSRKANPIAAAGLRRSCGPHAQLLAFGRGTSKACHHHSAALNSPATITPFSRSVFAQGSMRSRALPQEPFSIAQGNCRGIPGCIHNPVP